MPIPGNNLNDNFFMTPRIKCPWCKSDSVSEDHDENGWFIGCVNHDCEIRPSFWAKDQAEALKTWNKPGNDAHKQTP